MIFFITGLIVSAFCGFKFAYYTNDDYQISFLLTKGEIHNLYVNLFFSSFLSKIQHIFPTINCFVIIQHICCSCSIIAIVYVLLTKIKSFWGVTISIIVSTFVFASDILIVQYSQTPIVLCTSGFLLGYYASLFENRKKIRTLQFIFSILLVFVASLFRFTPFLVGIAISFLFLISILFFKYRIARKSNSIKSSICMSIKKCLSLLLVFVISFALSFGCFFCTETLNTSDSNFSNYIEYNNARMRIADYETVPYEGNEEFYHSVGIHSQTELSMFGYDKELYNAETLNKIADYSEQIVQNGDSKPIYALKKTSKRFIRSINDIYGSVLSVKEKLHLPIGNKLFILMLVILCVGILLLLFWIWHKFSTKRHLGKKAIFKTIYYLLIISVWITFFMIAKITDNSILFIPLFVIIVAAMFFDRTKNYIAYLLFSLATIGLYLYQYNFRISYRVTFTFLFPSIIYMLSLIEFPKIIKKRTDIVKAVVYSLMIISLIFSSVWCLQCFYPQCTLSFDMKLREYIDDNRDNVFIIGTPTNACVDEGYYNALLVPDVPKNEIIIAWSNSSDFFVKDLQDKQINNILLDSINSNKRIVIEENENNDLDTQKNNYEDFYNIHYFNGNNTIKLVLEKTFEYNTKSNNPERNIKKISIYRVVQK